MHLELSVQPFSNQFYMQVGVFSKKGRQRVPSLLFLPLRSASTLMAAAQAASSARQAVRAALHKTQPSPTAALAKPVKKQEKLAKTLEWLNKEPKPILERVNSLELTYAYRNDHLDTRYVHTLLSQTCSTS